MVGNSFNKKPIRALAAVASAMVCMAIVAGVCLFFSGSSQSQSVRDANWKFDDPLSEAIATGDDSAVERIVANQDSASGQPVDDSEGIPYEIEYDEDGNPYAANQLLLSFDGAMTANELTERLNAKGIEVSDVDLVSKTLEDGGVLVQVVYRGDKTPQQLCAELAQNDFANEVEPNYVMSICSDGDTGIVADDGGVDGDLNVEAVSNDPRISSQWGLDAAGAFSAWDMRKTDHRVTVAVIDTGVDYDHPDLAGNLVTSYAKNTYTNSTGASAVNDYNGHGTHVAGIVAATANNGEGVAGISYNAYVLPLKASRGDSGSMTHADLIEAIDYVTSLKQSSWPSRFGEIRVINMSLGDYAHDPSFNQAIQRAHNAGIVVVAAAGNDAKSETHYPSAYSNVIGVSALMRASSGDDVFDGSYSNYGSYVDIAAPGTEIYSTYLNGGYKNLDGTSMATPMVSGAAALVASVDSRLTPFEIESILKSTAEDKGSRGWDACYGYGALRLNRAVEKALDARFIEDAVVTGVDLNGYAYTGSPITPEIAVTYKGAQLIQGQDYRLSYSGNVNAGTASINVIGMGAYRHSRMIHFTINKAVFGSSNVSQIERQTYTGSDIKPDVSVVVNGKALKKDVDFTMTYANNRQYGTATATIRGIGNYSGVVTREFEITPEPLEKPSADTVHEYTGEEIVGFEDNDWYVISGDNTGVNAGGYTATVTLKDNAIWKDGTRDPVDIPWRIAPKKVEAPAALEDIVHTGDEIQGVPDGEGYELSGVFKATEVGVYEATATPTRINYAWTDGTKTPKKIAWEICPERYIDYPEPIEGLVYNGEEQQGVPSGKGYTLSGEKATSAGRYFACATLLPGYHWKAMTDEPKGIAWAIEKKPMVFSDYCDSEYSGNDISPNDAFENGCLRSIVQVASEQNDSNEVCHAVVAADGSLYMWGDNQWGQVGNGSSDAEILSPVKVLDNVAKVRISKSTVAAVTVDGSLHMWGANGSGQIGIGVLGGSVRSPVKVLGGVSDVCLANRIASAIAVDGSLYMWGANGSGQVGSDSSDAEILSPVKVLDNVAKVRISESTAAAITTDGSLYMWGSNNGYGQVGNGSKTGGERSPVKVLDFVREVYLFSGTTAAIATDGSLYMWGRNDTGQVGNGLQGDPVLSPVEVLDGILEVSLSNGTTSATASDGSLYMWGKYGNGVIGNESSGHPVLTPTRVLEGVLQAQIIASPSLIASRVTATFAAALTADGSLYIWGDNYYGALVGGAPKEEIYPPAKVLNGVSKVYFDAGTAYAVTFDGSLYSWGYNQYGQVGNGSSAKEIRSPVKVLDGVLGIDAVGNSVCAFTEDSLYWWGAGEAGNPENVLSFSNRRTDVGEYPVFIAPDSNHCWEDGSSDPRLVNWAIIPFEVRVPEVENGVFDGKEHVGVFGSDYFDLSGELCATDAGLYKATATLNNPNYVWEDGTTEPKEIEWWIEPKPVDVSDVVNEGLVYTGQRQIGVKSGEGYAITDGEFFASEVGSYKATLELLDDNHAWSDGTTESKEVEWSISRASYDLDGVSLSAKAVVYDGNPQNIEIEGDLPDGVSVSYEGNGQVEPGEYEIIAHFVGDAANYEAIPDKKATLTIEKIPVEIPEAEWSLSYNGSEQVGVTAPEDAPYVLSNTSATNAGVYSATASLKDAEHYRWNIVADEAGESRAASLSSESEDQTICWSISQASIWDVEAAPSVVPTYSGEAQEPSMDVRFNDMELEQGVDYEVVSYSGNVAAGTATVTIRGKGNFAGERLYGFAIAPADIATADVAAIPNQAYTGSEVRPAVAVSFNGASLEKGRDYDVTYVNNTQPGTATVTIQGKGNFTGSKVCTFKINEPPVSKTSLEKASVKLSRESFVYDGKVKKPTVSSVVLGGKKLSASSDYTVSYIGGLKNVGKYSVKVSGKGKYNGSVSKTYQITKAAQPMAVKAKVQTVAASKVAKSKVTLSKAITFSKRAQGKVSYARIAKGSSKCLSVNKSTGVITVAKRTAPGVYKINLKVSAAGNLNYKSGSKNVMVKVTVQRAKTKKTASSKLTAASIG